jgi:hydroxypyruvate reductase
MTHSLQDGRVARILAAALDAVEPGELVRRYLSASTLPEHEGLYLLGVGKAAEPMLLAAADALPHFAKALIITKHASAAERRRVQVMESSHPIPDARSVMAGRAALDLAAQLTEKDLLLCLVSGGGSSLASAPLRGVGLRDTQLLTTALLSAGASIAEVNTVRRHLDGFKGGGLVRATKARVLTLILSDVIGDRLEAVASGPTAPDPTSGTDALGILDKYGIPAPANVYSVLASQRASTDLPDGRVTNVVIGNNELAAREAQARAVTEGFRATILRTDLEGEASLVGQRLAERLRMAAEHETRPFCLIAGGETTVTIHGEGRGGRNQELALAAVESLAGLRDVLLVSLASDGDDGTTGAAGAVATGQTEARARALGMAAATHLLRNDAYPYFDALGDLLKPGYSGTNVNDLMFLIGL